MKFIAIIIFLAEALSATVNYSAQYVSDKSASESVSGYSYASDSDGSQSKKNSSHGESIPCGNACHSSGHCHYLSPEVANVLPILGQHHIGSSYSNLHPDPYLDGLFRPPII